MASLLDRRGAAPGSQGSAPPTAGMLRVGPPEEAPLPGVVAVAPDDTWPHGAGRGAPGGAEAIPKSPWPSQRPGACVRGLAVRCGFGTPLPRVGRWGGPGRRLPPVPPPCPVRTAGSHYLPSPSPRAPRAGGSPRPGEGRILINPRPEILPEGPGRAAGVRGAPVRSLAISQHPPPLSPPPASWKLGRQPTPVLRSTFLPLGTRGARKLGRPLTPVGLGSAVLSGLLFLWDSTAPPPQIGLIFLGRLEEHDLRHLI